MLAAKGWLTLRFGASDIRGQLDDTLDEIGAVRSARLGAR
jgi:very-short-patch-repair endonuclease